MPQRSRSRANRLVRSGLVLALLATAAVGALPVAAANGGRLDHASVTPAEGTTATPFTFSVRYRDGQGIPADVRVNVGGAWHVMTPTSTTWGSGVVFTLTTLLPAGTSTTTFEARNDAGVIDVLGGPTVGVAQVAVPTPPPTRTPIPTPSPTATPRPTPTATPAPTATTTPAPNATSAPGPTSTPTSPGGTSAPSPTPTTASPSEPPDEPAQEPIATPVPGPTEPGPSIPTDPLNPSPGAGGLAGPDGSPGGGAPAASHRPDLSAGSSSDPGAVPTVPTASSATGSGTTGDPGPRGEPSTRRDPVTPDGAPSGHPLGALGSFSGFGGSRLELTLTQALVVSAGATTMAMAFMFFGKRRRDGEPTEPDDVLAEQAAAARQEPADATLATPSAVPVDPDLLMPRWRRPSLLQARKADPIRDATPVETMTFADAGAAAGAGAERRLIRYHVVELLDAPDELRSRAVGSLTHGDEVQLLERSGAYWRVLCPNGQEGWVHRMTLGEEVGAAPAPSPVETWSIPPELLARLETPRAPDPEPALFAAFVAARRADA